MTINKGTSKAWLGDIWVGETEEVIHKGSILSILCVPLRRRKCYQGIIYELHPDLRNVCEICHWHFGLNAQ